MREIKFRARNTNNSSWSMKTKIFWREKYEDNKSI